ncbi:hypothetical protein DXG03_003682 [Asterophora parasitica]|uniref:Uncharacterized protein n=1 Tax=Asterophora parasitica TaxID=117018 RepID=A0A9P7G9I3_9AGAR|nr:hypothetical protein DXG03_003682 [Asterophora parasitica]
MFSRVFAVAAIILTFSAQAHAHAAVSPVLGVAGAPKRSDVQRPQAATPCGTTSIAAHLDSSTPVIARADGSFTVTAINFNGGRDGSRQVTLTVDSTGSGRKFVAGTVSKNGVLAPANTGSEQIIASLPPGTKCTGGAKKNKCLASFKTAAGFGNCVVVQQGGAAPRDVAAPAHTGNGGLSVRDRITAALTGAPGTRAARALRAELKDDHEEGDFEVLKRSVLSWIWA